MARIKTYINDSVITGGDRFLGTDAADNSTKNFTVSELADYYARTGVADPDKLSFQFSYAGLYNNQTLAAGEFRYQIDSTASTTSFGWANVTAIAISTKDSNGTDIDPVVSIALDRTIKMTNPANADSYAYFTVTQIDTIQNGNAALLTLGFDSGTNTISRSLTSIAFLGGAGSGGGTTLTVEEEGSEVGRPRGIDTLNFEGSRVTASESSERERTINIEVADVVSMVDDQNQDENLEFWSGTLEQYEMLTPDEDTLYYITDDITGDAVQAITPEDTDPELTGIRIGTQDYQLGGGTEVSAIEPTSDDATLNGIQIGDVRYRLPGGAVQQITQPSITDFARTGYTISGTDVSFGLTITVDLNSYTESPALTIVNLDDVNTPLNIVGGLTETDGPQTVTVAALTYDELPQQFRATLVSQRNSQAAPADVRTLTVAAPAAPTVSLSPSVNSGFDQYTPQFGATSANYERYDLGVVSIGVTRTSVDGWTPGMETFGDITVANPGTQAFSETQTFDFSYAISGVDDVRRTLTYQMNPIRSFRYGSLVPTSGMTLEDTLEAMTDDLDGFGDFTVFDNGTNTEIEYGTTSPLGATTINIIEGAHLYFMYDASLPDLNAIEQMAGVTIDYLAAGTFALRGTTHGYKIYTTTGLPFTPGSIMLNLR